MKIENPWRQLSSKVVYDNSQFRVREDQIIKPNGKEGKYFVIELPSSVSIVAVTKNNEAYLIGQHRYTSGLYSWETPCGSIDEQKPLNAAQRELQEETGLTASEWEDLGIIHALNGRTNKVFHVFLARSLKLQNENSQNEEGITRMEKFPFSKIFNMISSGEITSSETISSILKAAIQLKIVDQ